MILRFSSLCIAARSWLTLGAVAALFFGCDDPGALPPGSPCAEGEQLDGDVCVPEACGSGPYGDREADGPILHVAPDGRGSGDGSVEDPLSSIQAAADRLADEGGGEVGGTVAVAAGQYRENVLFDGSQHNVRVLGRCAALVMVEADDESLDVFFLRDGRYQVEGLTLLGGTGLGIDSDQGSADVVLRDLVVRRARGLGAWIRGAASRVDWRGGGVLETGPDAEGRYGRGVEIDYPQAVNLEQIIIADNLDAGLMAFGASVTLVDVTIRGTAANENEDNTSGMSINDGAEVLASGLRVEDNVEVGIILSGAGSSLEISDSTVQDSLPLPNGMMGRAFSVQYGAAVTGRDLVIQRSMGTAIWVAGAGSRFNLDDSVVRDTGFQPGNQFAQGQGIFAVAGARVRLRGVSFEGNHSYAVLASDNGTELEIRDCSFRDTGADPDAPFEFGYSLAAIAGGSILASNVDVAGGVRAGVIAVDPGSRIEISDSVVRDIDPDGSDGSAGAGLYVWGGAELVASGVLIEDTHETGVDLVSAGEPTWATLSDVTIRGVRFRPDLTQGMGIRVDGASLVGSSLLIEDVKSCGISIGGGGDATLSDVVVRDVRQLDSGVMGRGVCVEEGGSLDGVGLRIEDVTEVGLSVAEGSSVVVDDLRIARVRAASVSGIARGLNVQLDSSFEGSDVRIEDIPGTAAFFSGEDVIVELEGLQIARTAWSEDEDGRGGRAVGAQLGAEVLLRDVQIDDSGSLGLFVASAGTEVELRGASITHTGLGPEGYLGRPINVQSGARLIASDLVLDGGGEYGVFSLGFGTLVQLDGVLIRNIEGGRQPGSGAGMTAAMGGSIEATAAGIEDTFGPGLIADSGGRIECADCELSRVGFAGAVIKDGGALTLIGGSIRESLSNPAQGGGVGILAWDDGAPPMLTAIDVELSGHPGVALYLRGQGSYRVEGCLIRDSGLQQGFPGGLFAGEGVLPWDPDADASDGLGLLIQDSVFENVAAPAVLLSAASASFVDLSFLGVGGVEIQQQDCAGVAAPEIDGGSPLLQRCEGFNIEVEPLLSYQLRVTEAALSE